jgi:hypothetical protein
VIWIYSLKGEKMALPAHQGHYLHVFVPFGHLPYFFTVCVKDWHITSQV